jgi:hypothetical protein
MKTDLLHSAGYDITTLSLHTSDGNVVDLSELVLELNIFEDIFSPTMTCTMRINDGSDLISNFKFHGNEFLELELDKPSLNDPIKKVFRLYKLSDRSFDTNYQNYTLHFCSEEMILSPQVMISKSYRGLKVSDMVQDILRTYLKVNPKKINYVQLTEKAFDIIIPKMNPFEAVMWLSTKAYSTNDSLFLFFENRDGFNFTSYENLIKKPTYAKYAKDFKVDDDVFKNMASFNFLKILEDFDVMKSSRYGAFSSAFVNLNLITKKFTKTPFNAIQFKNKGILNKEVTMNTFKNRLNKSFYNSHDNMLKYSITTDADATRNPLLPEEWLSQTASKLGQIHLFKMIGTVPGDVMLRVGQVIEVDLPDMSPKDKGVTKNETRSGKYLISSVHHKISTNEESYVTILELISDSINEPMPSPKNSLGKLKELSSS